MKSRVQSALKDDPKAKPVKPDSINDEWEAKKSNLVKSGRKVGRPLSMEIRIKSMTRDKADIPDDKQATKGTPPAKHVSQGEGEGAHTCPRCGHRF